MTRQTAAAFIALSVAAGALQRTLPASPLQRYEGSRMSMGCLYAIEAYGPDAGRLRQAVDAAFDEVDRIDRLMSHYKADSKLSRINREAASHPVVVDGELFAFLKESLQYSRDTAGAFDITVGPLMKTWGFFRGEGRLPSDEAVTAARGRVGSHHVTLNHAARTVAFDAPGVELDLGGIAKGYAVDRAVQVLVQKSVTSALVSAGGSTVFGMGAPPHSDGWNVSIQDPLDSERTAMNVTLKDRALSIAGSSEKFFEVDGVTYSHIMDPRTGRPAQGVLSVAVLSSSGTSGDALDNALYVLGPDASRSVLSQRSGVEAFFFLPAPGGRWTRVHEPGLPRAASRGQKPTPDFEALPFAPRRAVVYRASTPLNIDGKLDEPGWAGSAWSEPFIDIEGDIEGDSRPRPPWATRVKMLWDDEHFYVAAEMEEPDLWGTLTERDSVIFHDNDFEVFIDPDGDTHAYYELEVNALGTPWDLMLIKPYRDGGRAIDAWDIAGLKVGIDLRGTINRPGDKDAGWTIEVAMPWRILREAAPERRAPRPGEQWRVNFSRVQWQLDVADGRYVKRPKPGTKDPLPENNWVWSPQGAINMHMPERWGYVQFARTAAGGAEEAFVPDPDEGVKWALRRLYYRQRAYRERNGRYATSIDQIVPLDPGSPPGLRAGSPKMSTTASSYEIVAPGAGGVTVHINDEGKVWTVRLKPDATKGSR